MKGSLPDEVVSRPKQAYRAPVASSLLSNEAPEYFREMLSSAQLKKHGIFKRDTVEKLVEKMTSGRTITENDNMAVSGILSTQILMDLFISGNSSFRETTMRTKCPVTYDKSFTKNNEQ